MIYLSFLFCCFSFVFVVFFLFFLLFFRFSLFFFFLLLLSFFLPSEQFKTKKKIKKCVIISQDYKEECSIFYALVIGLGPFMGLYVFCIYLFCPFVDLVCTSVRRYACLK